MDDLLDKVIAFARSKGIEVTRLYELSPVTPCGSDPSQGTIYINMNFGDQNQLPYQAGHEVQHVLEGHEGVLYFTPSKMGMEGAANRGSIDILVPLYFDSVEPEDANAAQFIDDCGISDGLRDYVAGAICDFYHKTDGYTY